MIWFIKIFIGLIIGAEVLALFSANSKNGGGSNE